MHGAGEVWHQSSYREYYTICQLITQVQSVYSSQVEINGSIISNPALNALFGSACNQLSLLAVKVHHIYVEVAI